MDTANARTANQRASGTSLRPFQDNQLATRHTEQISSDTISSEEFPWESLKEGGENAYVFPATREEQNGMSTIQRRLSDICTQAPLLTIHIAQAGGITSGYVNAGLNYGDALRISFINSAGALGTYCTALFSNPPDHSVCSRKITQTLFGVTAVDLTEFAFKVVKTVTPFTFVHVAGSKKGTKRFEDLVHTDLDAVHDAHLAY